MTVSKARICPALVLFVAITVSGCGSDSSGPGSIDSNAALQSLALGLQGVSGVGSPTTPEVNASFGGIAPLLDQVTVTIDGASQGMYALGLRETFPAGTCEETLFVSPTFPPPPDVCTPPQLELAVILWQSHSASQPPDRMILIVADTGRADFDFASAPTDQLPADAVYVEGENSIWSSLSGTLSSKVAATSQTCSLPLPPYGKSGLCNVATFDEQGSIVFEPFSFDAANRRLNLTIPPLTLHGLWIAISEVQSVPITATRIAPALLSPRFMSRARLIRGAITPPSQRTILAR